MGWIRAVALDLDGTIASADAVDEATLDAVKAARYRGVRVLLVTGRTVQSLHAGFPGLVDAFDVVVAENGAVLVAEGRHQLLAEPVPARLADRLQSCGIGVHRGQVLLDTGADRDTDVLRAVADLGLDCVLLRNRSRLMILPAGVSKGSGLQAALDTLRVSPHNVIAVGDAENDHAMFEVAELGVAPANAVPAVLEHADVVLEQPNGRGVRDLLAGPVVSGELRPPSRRRQLPIGSAADGSPVLLPSTPSTILLVGGSGRGKSYVAGVLAEQLIDRGYSVLVVDPEGEQNGLSELDGVELVDAAAGDAAQRAVALLRGGASVVLDASTMPAADRAAVMLELSDLVTLERAASGHPQWVFVDEAQDLIGADGPLRAVFDPTAGGHVLASYRPEQLSARVLANADTVLSTSSAVDQLLGTGSLPASMLPRAVGGHAVLVQTDRAVAPRPFTVAARRTRHHRHLRKYLHHPVPAGRGFRFRPGGVTLPEARSVEQFRSQVEQVDGETLRWHLARGDVSRWLAEVVQDRDLSESVARLEHDLIEELGAAVGRARAELTAAIDRRYRETAATG